MAKYLHHRRYRHTVPRKRRQVPVQKPTSTVDIEVVIAEREPDVAHPEALSALADAAVAQMFDLPLGETLRVAYTVVQKHQERQTRRAIVSDATTALREHLARLDETVDDV